MVFDNGRVKCLYSAPKYAFVCILWIVIITGVDCPIYFYQVVKLLSRNSLWSQENCKCSNVKSFNKLQNLMMLLLNISIKITAIPKLHITGLTVTFFQITRCCYCVLVFVKWLPLIWIKASNLTWPR